MAEEVVDRGYAIAKVKSGIIGVQVWIVKSDVMQSDAFRLVSVNKEGEEDKKEEQEGKKEE
jgi:ribosomal protein S3